MTAGWFAAAVVAAFLAVMLRRYAPENALAVGLAAGVLLLAVSLGDALPLFRELTDLLNAGGVSGEYVSVLFKALGICLLTQLAADACRDAGEQGLASKTELMGKLALLMLALPLFRKVAEIAVTIAEGGAG